MRNNNDVMLLSAYLDGALSTDERTALEARLSSEPELREELEELRYVMALLQEMPRLKAPRSYTLDPAVYGRKARSTRRIIYPWRSLGAVAAAVVIFIAGVLFFASSVGDEPAREQASDSVAENTVLPLSTTQDGQSEIANAPTPTPGGEDRSGEESMGAAALFFEETAEPTRDESLVSEMAQQAADTALQTAPEQTEPASPYDPLAAEAIDPEQSAMEIGNVPPGVAPQGQVAPEAGSGGAGGDMPSGFGGGGEGDVSYAAEMPAPMPTTLSAQMDNDQEESDDASISAASEAPAVPPAVASGMTDSAAEPESAANEGYVDDALARKAQEFRLLFNDLLGIFRRLNMLLSWNS